MQQNFRIHCFLYSLSLPLNSKLKCCRGTSDLFSSLKAGNRRQSLEGIWQDHCIAQMDLAGFQSTAKTVGTPTTPPPNEPTIICDKPEHSTPGVSSTSHGYSCCKWNAGQLSCICRLQHLAGGKCRAGTCHDDFIIAPLLTLKNWKLPSVPQTPGKPLIYISDKEVPATWTTGSLQASQVTWPWSLTSASLKAEKRVLGIEVGSYTKPEETSTVR